MKSRLTSLAILAAVSIPIGRVACGAAGSPLPVRGLYLMAPKPEEVPLTVRFIREALPKESVNLLVMEFDYRYQFTRRPEVTDPDALSKDDVKKIAAACAAGRSSQVPLQPKLCSNGTYAS